MFEAVELSWLYSVATNIDKSQVDFNRKKQHTLTKLQYNYNYIIHIQISP